MKKIYEIKGKQTAQIVVKYFGVERKFLFEGGDIIRANGATYATADRFEQDAIEHDFRFGKIIFIRATYMTEAERAEAAAPRKSQEQKPASGNSGSKGNGGSKNSGKNVQPTSGDTTPVPECKDINDVVEYFAQKGEVASNNEQLRELADKYNVSFPNVKL